MIGPDKKRPQEQAVAACLNIWREKDKTKQCDPPEDDESEEEFMDRCVDETGDEDQCAMMWEQRRNKPVQHKTHASTAQGFEFVLSDETPDRMDDVIVADGWEFRNFLKNPIALFGHRPDFPIGKWRNLRIENGQLRGHLQMAPEGTSPRIDEIRKLIEADILRAVSVGFRPIDSEPRKGGGMKFLKAELIETSLVTVPANPNALAIAKSLNISRDTIETVFAGQGNNRDRSVTRRGFTGGQAVIPPDRKNRTMSPLTKRIEDTQQRIVRFREELTTHLEKVDDDNITDADLVTTQELNKKIADGEALLITLRESELRLAKTAADDGEGDGANGHANGHANGNANGNGGNQTMVGSRGNFSSRPFSFTPKKLKPLEYMVRAGTVRALARSLNMPIDAVRQKVYGDDEATKIICDLTLKAASAPAMTTVTGWAAELVQQVVTDVMETLLPASVYPSLSGMGLRLSFGRNGRIIVPTRSVTPTVAGSFVGEGAPIPVRQAGFTSQTMVPKKMAVITTWTREMDEHSVPAIEGLLRNAIQEDTAISIDSVLLDNNAATAVRPAGLRNGVAGLTPTPITNGAFAALVGDLKALTGAILTATAGHIRKMVFIMNPMQALSISFIQPPNPGGLFPFAAEMNAGRLNGSPVITSGTVPVGTVICMDAADFVSVNGDDPRFEISDQATLHMEDTTPVNIGTAGTPAVVAAPAVSMFQTDSMALRLILPMNWAVRRTGVVAWVAGVTW